MTFLLILQFFINYEVNEFDLENYLIEYMHEYYFCEVEDGSEIIVNIFILKIINY